MLRSALNRCKVFEKKNTERKKMTTLLTYIDVQTKEYIRTSKDYRE
jgi:hypothetical protein